MPRLRSPIWWFGGKGNMVAKILPILENIPHRIYIEPFGGGASLLIAKQPKPVEVYNDLDLGLYNFFNILSDPEKFEQFYRRVNALPYHRQLYYDCVNEWESETDDIIKAVKWFVIARQSFGGRFDSGWSFTVKMSDRGMAATASKWLSIIEMLPEIHARLQQVQIECNDFRKIIDTYDTLETLFYLDPPYVIGTRKGGGYKHEISDDDHHDLIEKLINLKGSAVVSGYNNPIYNILEHNGYTRKDFQTACYAAGRTRTSNLQGEGSVMKKAPRTESLWIKINNDTNNSIDLF